MRQHVVGGSLALSALLLAGMAAPASGASSGTTATPTSEVASTPGTPADTAAPAAAGSITVSGKITTADGQPAAGAVVVVQERTTNAESFAIAAADGTYSYSAAPGVYDELVTHVEDPDVPAQFEGPIELTSDTTRDRTLAQQTVQAGRVSGLLELSPGVPLANTKISLMSRTAGTEGRVTATTAADGTFDVYALFEENEFDFEVYQADGQLDEFVSLDNIDGRAVRVHLITGGEVEDTTRMDAAAEPRANLLPNFTVGEPSLAFARRPAKPSGSASVSIAAGERKHVDFTFAAGPHTVRPFDEVWVSQDNGWIYKYSVHWTSSERFAVNRALKDATGDVYTNGWANPRNSIDYNSRDPRIVTISGEMAN